MMRVATVACMAMVVSVGASGAEFARPDGESPYLFLFAGDQDMADSDFLAVIDLRPESPTLGKVIATTPIGLKASMPHHMDYVRPPDAELLFMNAHHLEKSLLVDVSDPLGPRVAKSFDPPAPLRYPHDYSRTPTGTRLVGFLRSEGPSADPAEAVTPGNHGGIAEYTAEGELLRMWTTNCARALFPDRRAGSLDPGNEASFLALGADPLANFDAVRNIRLRVKQGAVLEVMPPPNDE